MKTDNLLFRGTKIKFFNSTAYNPGLETIMLVESHEAGYPFQLVCITDYNSGRIYGYVKEDSLAILSNSRAISLEHLVREMERNIGPVDLLQLEILED